MGHDFPGPSAWPALPLGHSRGTRLGIGQYSWDTILRHESGVFIGFVAPAWGAGLERCAQGITVQNAIGRYRAHGAVL